MSTTLKNYDLDQILLEAKTVLSDYCHRQSKYRHDQSMDGTMRLPAELVVEFAKLAKELVEVGKHCKKRGRPEHDLTFLENPQPIFEHYPIPQGEFLKNLGDPPNVRGEFIPGQDIKSSRWEQRRELGWPTWLEGIERFFPNGTDPCLYSNYQQEDYYAMGQLSLWLGTKELFPINKLRFVIHQKSLFLEIPTECLQKQISALRLTGPWDIVVETHNNENVKLFTICGCTFFNYLGTLKSVTYLRVAFDHIIGEYGCVHI